MTETDPFSDADADSDDVDSDAVDSGLESSPIKNIYEFLGFTRFLDLPPLLHSVEKDGPFTHCLHCDAELLNGDRPYMIEKIIRGTEVIIEIAMCFACRDEKQDDGISAESQEAIQQFFRSSKGVQNRMQVMNENRDAETIDPWLANCLLSGEPADQFREYQIIAVCCGDKVQCDVFPALLSGPAMVELESVLSEKTKGWMEDYLGSNFGMPSEFCTPPGFKPVLI